MLDVEKILAYSGGDMPPLEVFDVIDSTNRYAKDLLVAGETVKDGTLFLANQQTAGHGRQGHSFYSPANTGLYVTLVRTCPLPAKYVGKLTLAAGVSTLEAIETVTSKHCGIKWVNDLYLDGKKVAGILAEASGWNAETNSPAAVVIGIGINCSTESWPEDIKEKAGALSDTGIDREKLAAELWRRMLHWTNALVNDDYDVVSLMMELYKTNCFVLGKDVSFELNGSTYEATALDIADNGNLIIRTHEASPQTLSLDSGEIHLKRYQ